MAMSVITGGQSPLQGCLNSYLTDKPSVVKAKKQEKMQRYVTSNAVLQHLRQTKPAGCLFDLDGSNAQPMPGARELVELCHKKNIPMAIATSSGMQAVLVKLKPHPWLESIKVRVHGDDANIDRGKPAPDLFIEAAKQLNVDPKNCWAFEDSPAGATAAFAAGCEVFVLPAPGLNAKDYPEKSIILETLFNVPI
ncbi:MAG: HAD family hydrolase [Synechococcaceae bacterium WB4_2_0805]|nr:HAD family hydrolase [Synechococcaceae bacterium WB4_2_0805]